MTAPGVRPGASEIHEKLDLENFTSESRTASPVKEEVCSAGKGGRPGENPWAAAFSHGSVHAAAP
jgi:hypothetical protein